ncbi:HupE/UreJ family protein [Aquabacterium sp.]|uniref:HupE/UreJ family protein n=1 Tax=Aquabacterium sp. TaxID=1872578 RepID=UPI0025C0D052|nr:HupE/UreJ family protein [Aquabacterium sp.]
MLTASFRPWVTGLLASLALLACPTAQAHKASDAYLQLSRQGELLALRWDVALRDLDAALGLDANGDNQLSWGEVKTRRADIEAHLQGSLSLQPNGAHQACALRAQIAEPPIERRIDGSYLVTRLTGACPLPQGQAQLRYRFMQGIDPTHRGLVQLSGRSGQVWSLTPDGRPLTLALPDAPRVSKLRQPGWRTAGYTPDLTVPPPPHSPPQSQLDNHPRAETQDPIAAAEGFPDRVREGIHHILIGTDHVLFVLCLLLPAVLRTASNASVNSGPGSGSHREPVDNLRQALWPVLATVTAFTVAHSITLALAALGHITLSPRLIEPAIALTIALAAIDNIRPILGRHRHAFTFGFGLVHGFGFAGLLGELNLPTQGFVQALLGFNLGVEIGQLMVVLPALAILMALRRLPAYASHLMPAGSALALLVAIGWFTERAFDLGFMPV